MTIAWASHFPSPLLAMLLEGICLLILMLWFWRLQKLGIWNHRSWILSGIFLIGYSTARLISEQYRLPDSHIGYLLDTDWVTLGILYTVPMMGYGVYLVIKNFRFLKNKKFKAEKFFR
jgi:phosphatidylglycerol:prolipoprotein diacylglycerol transferase